MLHLNFIYSYQAFNRRSETSESHPSTTTWEDIFKNLCSWQSYPQPMRREWDKWAWPGGYPLAYFVKDGGILCADCANLELERTLDPEDEDFFVTDAIVNWEDTELQCDHCNKLIESAYGEEDEAA